MEKYKSEFIQDQYLRVKVNDRMLGEKIIYIVELRYLGFISSSEHADKVQAYNEALMALEDMINDFINSHA